MPKKPKRTLTAHEALVLQAAKIGRKFGLNLTDDELLAYLRRNQPPSTPPQTPPAPKQVMTGQELRALLEMFARIAAVAAAVPHPYPQFPNPGSPPWPPPPAMIQRPAQIPWRVILGFPKTKDVTADEIQTRWRKLSTIYHPDMGGASESFQAITDARDAALREVAQTPPA